MEWFAVSSAVTTSLAWAGADARARGAWVSLADVCRQSMSEGRIRAARTQLSRVCRLARVGAGDLRAVINAVSLLMMAMIWCWRDGILAKNARTLVQRSVLVYIGNANKANNAKNRLMSRRSPPTTSRFYQTPFANRSRTRTHTPTRISAQM